MTFFTVLQTFCTSGDCATSRSMLACTSTVASCSAARTRSTTWSAIVRHLVGDRVEDRVDERRAQHLGAGSRVVQPAAGEGVQVDRDDAGVEVEGDALFAVLRLQQVLHQLVQVADVDRAVTLALPPSRFSAGSMPCRMLFRSTASRPSQPSSTPRLPSTSSSAALTFLVSFEMAGLESSQLEPGQRVVAGGVLAVGLRLGAERADREVEVEEGGGELVAQQRVQVDGGVRSREPPCPRRCRSAPSSMIAPDAPYDVPFAWAWAYCPTAPSCTTSPRSAWMLVAVPTSTVSRTVALSGSFEVWVAWLPLFAGLAGRERGDVVEVDAEHGSGEDAALGPRRGSSAALADAAPARANAPPRASAVIGRGDATTDECPSCRARVLV